MSFILSDSGSSGGFVFQQEVPLAVWVITHNLNRHPAVVVEDSTGRRVEGDIVYTSNNVITITFTAAFSGRATLI